jgi:hypothetical protein
VLLESRRWVEPELDHLPTAGELVDRYLAPLSAIPAIASGLHLGHRVICVSRDGFDKAKSKGREAAAFVIRCSTPEGEVEHRADAVIDASGTWGKPNPLGANGLPAIGEVEAASRISYGMPDILGGERARYAGKRVVVAGAGHSAAGSLLALAKLAEEARGTQLVWTIRGHDFSRIFGGGENDGLAARGALGKRLQGLSESGSLEVHADFRTVAIRQGATGLAIDGVGPDATSRSIDRVDEIIVAAGGRPDLSITSELRLKLDHWIESTEQLAPLIDPNVHSCGTVRPHGHRELSHPEARFYTIGAKSYGRAPNFLIATGHEQARSVVAALAGDLAAADDVQLELPETGVCSTRFDEASSGCCSNEPAEPIAVGRSVAPAAAPAATRSSCCGGPPQKVALACCAQDEDAKQAGKAGCGSARSQGKQPATRCGG